MPVSEQQHQNDSELTISISQEELRVQIDIGRYLKARWCVDMQDKDSARANAKWHWHNNEDEDQWCMATTAAAMPVRECCSCSL